MSLRRSACLTPELLAAARTNSQHSTGPRTPPGKCHAKLNALKHGERSDPENHYQVMRALGEDPLEFESLRQELAASFGAGDALFEKQVDDLARLYWRRERLERAQSGLMRRARLAVEERQGDRQKAIAAATFDSSQSAATDIDLGEPSDPCVRLRMLLSLLGVIREQVRQRIFRHRQKSVLETYYRDETGWRQARFRHLLWVFSQRLTVEQQLAESELKKFMKQYFGTGESAVEARYQELLGLLDEELADVKEEFEHEVEVQEERTAIECDACLAPAGDEWRLLLRREEALDRSIDRKIKLLLSLRKESEPKHPPAPEPESVPAALDEVVAAPGETEPVEAIADTKLNERSGNVDENKDPGLMQSSADPTVLGPAALAVVGQTGGCSRDAAALSPEGAA